MCNGTRQWFIVLAWLFNAGFLSAQSTFTQLTPAGPTGAGILDRDMAGRPLRLKNDEDVEGSPYLFESYNPGSVWLKNGKMAGQVSLRFSLYDQSLYFLKGGVEMEVADTVRAFLIRYVKDGDSAVSYWQNGFPSLDGKDENTFYEVLTNGPPQLLRFRKKRIDSYREYGKGEKRKFLERRQLYAYLPGGRMIRLRSNRDALARQMPEYSKQILQITGDKQIRFRTDADLVLLFTALASSRENH